MCFGRFGKVTEWVACVACDGRKSARETQGHLQMKFGKVTEWLKVPLSKSGMGESSSRVRIPPFPPN